MSDFSQVVPWIGLGLSLLFLVLALRSGKRRRLVDDTPTSKTTGIFIGLVEVKGTAESAGPLTSYLAECACVWYDWSVQEHWSRTVVETYTDNEGRTQTRTRTESGWTTVANGGEMIPFYLQDDRGVVLVRPEGADVEPATVFSETCGPLSPLYYAKGPAWAVSDSTHRRMFVERAVPLHAMLYVMGQAREREDIVAAEIAADKAAPIYLISTRSEEQVSRGFGTGYWAWGIAGMVLLLLGFGIADNAAQGQPSVLKLILLGVGYFMAWSLGWVWMVYNSLINLRQRVRQGWSQVDVQLKRRFDLIPNLVETVKGLRDYESNLQTELASLRSQMSATPPGEPGPDYQACRATIVAIAEKYPELTAQQSFLNLQENLTDTEDRIALARGYFNEIATFYNARLEVVPDRFVARLGNLQAQALILAGDFERAPVTVDFSQ